MHVQIIEFRLRDLDARRYAALCDELAPMFADIPGLRAKVWLADGAGNRFGGIYLWADHESMEAFSRTELHRSVIKNPCLEDITSRDFEVLEAPTGVTLGVLPAA